MRTIRHRYVDPLDQVWIDALGALGFRLRREPGAYATTDGKGTLTIAVDDELDADDSLAQMIFHELCHAAVQGPESFRQRDWGLDNESDRDEVREHATLRAQAFLLRPLGLRTFLGPTTDFRAYYDALPADPLAGDDPAIPLARLAIGRMGRPPFAPHVGRALEATATILHAASGARSSTADLPSLHDTTTEGSARHVAGPAMPAPGSIAADRTCGQCAWYGAARRGRCASTGAALPAASAACERWEPEVACETCGACCREAFHVILLGPKETFVRKHPELVVLRDGQPELPRPDGRCPPLTGDGRAEPYRCAVHADRPRTCRDFTTGSANCLDARRRVGLSL